MTDQTPIKKQMSYHLARMYCLRRHHSQELCPECQEALERTYKRLDACPFKEEGRPCPTCDSCCFTGADYYRMIDSFNIERRVDDVSHGSTSAHTIVPDPSEKPFGSISDQRVGASIDSVKKSFLGLLEKKRFKDISVSEVCDDAGVGRTTFYAHFRSMDELLDSVLYDFTCTLDFMPSAVGYPGWPHEPAGMPFCIAIRGSKAMQRVFFDPELVDRCVGYVNLCMMPRLVHSMVETASTDPEGFGAVFKTQIFACVKALKDSTDVDDAVWDKRRRGIDRFCRGGLENLVSLTDASPRPLSSAPLPDAPAHVAGNASRSQ